MTAVQVAKKQRCWRRRALQKIYHLKETHHGQKNKGEYDADDGGNVMAFKTMSKILAVMRTERTLRRRKRPLK